MPRRGPRAGIVAGVLAAIGSFAAGSHVEASPMKGLVMPKLVIATIVVATLGAAGILAADSSRTPRKSPASTSAPPVVSVTPVPATPVAAKPGAPKAAAASKPGAATVTAPAAPTLPPATTIAVPDCAAVGKHMATLTMAKLPKQKPFPAAKLALIEKDATDSTTRKCTADHWSETMRLCIVDADDYDRSRECTDEVGATPAELVGLPAELGCKVLAAHAYGIANAPDGKFGMVRRHLAAQPNNPENQQKLKQVEQLIIRAQEQLGKDCDAVPWTVEKRKCMAAAKTQQDLASCR